MQIFAAYAIAALLFMGIDLVWLGVVARDLYRQDMGELIAPNFRLLPALAFYALYIGGMLYFAVLPGLRGGSGLTALISGAVLGAVAYGTYDLTNLAVVKNWPLRLALVDMAWGTVLTGLVSGCTVWILLKLWEAKA